MAFYTNKKVVVSIFVWITLFQIYILHNTWTIDHKVVSRNLKFKEFYTKYELEYYNNKFEKVNSSVKGIEFFQKNRSKIQKISIEYEQFIIPEPNFISESDRLLFHKNKLNNEMKRIQNETEKLRGEIYNIRDGTFQMPYDCGYKSDYSYILKNRKVPKDKWYFTIVPMLIPDGHTFQHFIDGTLPKIVQILDFLRKPFVKMLYKMPRDKIIYEMLDRLRIPSKNIIYYTSGTIGADNLLFSCNTPPIHPALWNKARTLIGAHEIRRTSWEQSQVIVVTRAGSFNGGRNIINMKEMVEMLASIYGKNNFSIFSGPYTLDQSIESFGKAKILIGVHGGGLYNMLFCPKNTTIVEIMPTYESGKMVAAADRIFWMQSALLGHNYWRLLAKPYDSRGNVKVNITKLRNILYKIDSIR